MRYSSLLGNMRGVASTMNRYGYLALRLFSWLLVANALVAAGFVANTQISLWLPEYGQGFWWAWGAAFAEAPENGLFIVLGICSFILLNTGLARKGKEKSKC